MTNDTLRHNYTDAFIALVMDEAAGSTMDLSSEDQREAIVLALQDAIEFFSAVEYGTEIPE